jgi:hypothetical protein
VPFIFFVAPIIVLRGQDNLSSTLDAEPYEAKAVIGFNALWFVCFFLGLQYTHLNRGPLKNF